MLRVLLSVLMFSAGLSMVAQEPKGPKKGGEKKDDQVAVALNTGGHTSEVAALAFTPDGKKLVTCETTKVHVWKLPECELERTWRTPAYLTMITISPDGKTVAAMGNVEVHPVWLLDLETGEHKTFRVTGVRGHYGINSLAFSKNGRRLAWCTWYQAGVINIANERVSNLVAREGPAATVAFDNSPSGERLLVNGGDAGRKNQFQVFDVKGGKDRKDNNKLFDLEESALNPGLVTWSTDNKYFVGCYEQRGGRLFVWSAEGTKDKRPILLPPGDFRIHHVQFIGPEKVIAVATLGNKVRAYTVNAAEHKVEKYEEFPWHNPDQAPVRVAVSPTGTHFAMSNSPGFRVQLFDLATDKRPREVGQSFPKPQSVAWGPDNRSISWNFGRDRRGNPITPRGLNLSTLKLLDEEQVKGFNRVTRTGFKLPFDETKKQLSVLHQGKRVVTEFDAPVTVYTVYTDTDGKTKLVVLGDWGVRRLSIIDPETGQVTDINKFSNGTAISVSPDGRLLLLARDDQVMSLYRLDGAGGAARLQLRIFSADQDWIVWTPNGFYASTFNAQRMMGFTTRTDEKTPLTFHLVERFQKQLYKPELVRQVLDRGSIVAAAKATNTPPIEVKDIERMLPPKSDLVLVSQTESHVTVKATATTVNGKPVEAMRLQLNGRSVFGDDGYFEPKPNQKPEVTWKVPIPPGEHQLSVLVRGSDSSDRSNSITVKANEPEDQKPKLFGLAVGLNYKWDAKYKNDPGWLDAAENDATTVLTALEKHCVGKGNRFGKIEAAPPLVGQAATTDAILAGLKAIRQKGAKPGDLVVLFYAGHGVAEGRDFYLLTANVDPKDIPSSCLSGSKLRDELKAMPCQVLLILDACQSGRALDKFAPITDAVGRALADDEAGITVLAAAMAHENAGESGGNGRLTRAMSDTLARPKEAFYDREAKIMNIDHLSTRVKDLVRNESKGKQNPVLLAPWSSPPLVIRRIPN